MIEIVPETVDSAFMYFHTRFSAGNEIAPFVEDIRTALPHTYIWAGDGCIEGEVADPVMRKGVNYGTGPGRYWFVFPMQSSSADSFVAATEAMGAVLATCGGYVNAMADQVMARFHIPASRVVLCGHQHGSCAALAAAMMRRVTPFALTVLFDPWPLETLYLQHEPNLPSTKVACIDNLWVREREKQRGADVPLFQVFQGYGMNATGTTLPEGRDRPDRFMFQEAVRQIQDAFGINI